MEKVVPGPSANCRVTRSKRELNSMYSIIARIGEILQSQSEIQHYEIEEDCVVVYPRDETGFSVSIKVIDDPAYLISYGYWCNEFETADIALRYFWAGLSGSCRMLVTRKGQRDTKWVVECLSDNEWEVHGKVSLPKFAFWQKKETRYLSNNWPIPQERQWEKVEQ